MRTKFITNAGEMNIHDIRALLAADKTTIGTWLQLPSADVAELMAGAGYDWVAADMEHASFDRGVLPDIFRAIENGGAVPFARLPDTSKTAVKAALEAGAQGLIFPMVESRVQLDAAIDVATYPGQDFWRKDGTSAGEYRGVGYCRANAFGKNFDAYLNGLAPDIFFVAQIEHIRAVENLDAILAHPRLDAVMVGPYDLSGSMGLTGQFDHPDFRAAMSAIHAGCARHKAHMGMHIVRPDERELDRQIKNGARFIAYGIDAVFLWLGAERPRQEQ
jgi:2-dehydro-3-deoxyglucarate aldolase